MSNKALVSVIMPVFNAATYLDEAIESILLQSFTHFELLIINDGSTDNSLSLLKKWEAKDKRVKIYNQNNQGKALSRNRGLELASTDYIAMMDADDIAMPNRLRLCYQYLEKHRNVVAVSGQFETICMHGVHLDTSIEPLEHDEIEQSLLQDLGAAFIQGASMMRKAPAKNAGGYDPSYKLGEDTDLFLRMALKGKLANLPDVLLKYRKHPFSVTTSTTQDSIPECRQRVKKAWLARGLILDENFHHWLEEAPKLTTQEQLLWWGWNALRKEQIAVSRRYAVKLLFSFPLSKEKYRFILCAIRGR